MTPPSFSSTGIRFENIDKRFGGLYALRRVSLEIDAGECVVFAGRNGSGKTTLLRTAARLTRPSSGSVSFVNSHGEKNETLLPVGFVAHATMVYDELTAEENLLLFARLQGIAKPAARSAKLLREVGLAIAGHCEPRGARREVTSGGWPGGAARFIGAHVFSRNAPACGDRESAAE